MAIGFTAFVFKIYLNADSSFSYDLKHALEFAGPYLSIFFIKTAQEIFMRTLTVRRTGAFLLLLGLLSRPTSCSCF